MPTAAITVEVLPAGHGDCLLVSCPAGRRTWRMLVDTGPDETYPALQARLKRIPKGAGGRRYIDLFVVTHIDHDHIGGAAALLNDGSLGLRFGDIWFNAPPRRGAGGVAEGQRLASLLGADKRSLPWNVAWSSQPVCTPADGASASITSATGAPTITVLSPAPKQLKELFSNWTEALADLSERERAPAGARRSPVPLTSLEALAAHRSTLDTAVPNGSSIALLVEHQGASVLLAADAFANVLVPAVKALVKRRGGAGALHVDALKLSHHGSRANVTRELLDAIEAGHYIVSTNNAYFNHPNDEALARVVVRGKRPTLWFNYDTPANRRWADEGLVARYGHAVRYPGKTAQGIVLRLPKR